VNHNYYIVVVLLEFKIERNVIMEATSQTNLVNSFSSAKGEYDIGTASFIWSPKDDQTAQYLGQIWYPAISTECPNYASYLPETVYQSSLQQDPMVAAVHSVITDAAVDGPLLPTGKPYPALFFSPGNGMYRQQNNFMFEYLASRGFIIVSVDHPGTSGFTEKADGNFVLMDTSVDDNDSQVRANSTEQRVEQLRTVLDTILSLNDDPQSKFYKSIDTDKIGAFGHSRGGVTALRASSIDKRFKAAANFDGGIGTGEIIYDFCQQEVLMLMSPMDELVADGSLSETDYKTYIELMHSFMISNESSLKYQVSYKGVRHMNFTDLPLVVPTAPSIGSSDPEEV
jgi:dienelactone hydrolase